jgi:steroid delta-isomerase-like uncharacterized protein
MGQKNAKNLMSEFYKFFNEADLENLFSLISDDIIHEMNFDKTEGKKAFIEYIKYATKHYHELVCDPIIMMSEDGKHGAALITVKGKYIKTDKSGIKAQNQPYILSVINYCEVENGLITKARAYFNESSWLDQINSFR